ncbi:glycosyltransferase [Escherichia coli]|uniref:glycosyltransferase n=1 Tax=Escherichia coli TaxID=562 RepID=UPI00388F7A45
MKILPVIVLYKKKIEECESLFSLIKMDGILTYIDTIYIHDNSANENQPIKKYGTFKVKYYGDGYNHGVSKAYNDACRYAKENGYTWLLLLDQDTQFPENALNEYCCGINSYPGLPLYVPVLRTKDDIICSPCAYRWHRGFTPRQLKIGVNSLNEFSPINSGMLIRVESFIAAGGYNEKVYLDFSDFQFIERVRIVQDKFCIINLEAKQDFSNDTNDVRSLISRFKIYCECALNCEKKTIIDKIQYASIVFARTSKLFIRTKI